MPNQNPAKIGQVIAAANSDDGVTRRIRGTFVGQDVETEIDVAGWSVFGWSASSGGLDYRRPRPRLGCGDVNCARPDELDSGPKRAAVHPVSPKPTSV